MHRNNNEEIDFEGIFEGYDPYDRELAKTMKMNKKKKNFMSADDSAVQQEQEADKQKMSKSGSKNMGMRKSFPVEDSNTYKAVQYIGAPIFNEFEIFHGTGNK